MKYYQDDIIIIINIDRVYAMCLTHLGMLLCFLAESIMDIRIIQITFAAA